MLLSRQKSKQIMIRLQVSFRSPQIKTQQAFTALLRLVFFQLLARQAPMLRIRALSRLLVRAALFLWIRPLFTMVSIFGTAVL